MKKMGKTVEELKEKSQKALENPKLVEIVKTALKNKDGWINLSWVYEQAFEYVYQETKDLKKAKELAVSTRWLAMLRRDYEEEFEKVVRVEQPEKGAKVLEPKQLFHQIEFRLCRNGNCGVELITREGSGPAEHFIKFYVWSMADIPGGRALGLQLAMQILNALIETAGPSGDMNLLNDLIQFLEEKFGLEPFIEVLEKNGIIVRVCGNCKEFVDPIGTGNLGKCKFNMELRQGGTYADLCEHWAPKEVSGKEKVCRTCACRKVCDTLGDPTKNESYTCRVYGLKQCVVSGQCNQWKE